MEILSVILTSEAFWGLASMLLTAAFGFLWKFLRGKGIESKAVDALRDGVANTQDKFVTFAKRAAEDGKLTQAERDQAKAMAFQEALLIAKGPVKNLLIDWAGPKVDALINRIVGSKK